MALGRKGGKATAENRTAEERAEAARKAVEARWAKQKKLITAGTKELLKASKANARRAKARRLLVSERRLHLQSLDHVIQRLLRRFVSLPRP